MTEEEAAEAVAEPVEEAIVVGVAVADPVVKSL